MNFELLRLHGKLIITVFMMIALTLTLAFSHGIAKPADSIEWPDVLGEGGIALITLVWMFFIMISRPSGRVTSTLVAGLLFVHLSLLLDVMDEFLQYPSQQAWLLAYESLPAPIGMILMTFGLYHWHREQLLVNEQLQRRERSYREHGLVDFITGLYSADYMTAQISREIEEVRRQSKRNFSLLMLDIDDFDAFIRRYGDKQGDRFLREVAELILINIRTCDLACRYAGDRFIVLVPESSLSEAEQMAEQIKQAVAHFAFKPERSTHAIYQKVSISVSHANDISTANSMLADLNQQMEAIKLSVKHVKAA